MLLEQDRKRELLHDAVNSLTIGKEMLKLGLKTLKAEQPDLPLSLNRIEKSLAAIEKLEVAVLELKGLLKKD